MIRSDRCCSAVLVFLLSAAGPQLLIAGPEALEVGPGNVSDLPGGREADGIIGDFVLRNDRIEAVISGNLHNRKANLYTHSRAPTPGCLYDLTLRDQDNVQLTWLGPGRQEGQLSSVHVLKSGEDGEAVIRAELTPEAGGGLGKIHDYILRDGWQYLLIVSTYHNASDENVRVDPLPVWKGLVQVESVEGVTTGLCQDPADRVGYAFAPVEAPDREAAPAEGRIQLEPGASRRFAAAVSIGQGAAKAYGIIAGLKHDKMASFQGRILDTDGRPAPDAVVLVPVDDKLIVAYADPDGRFAFDHPRDPLPVTVRDLGRPDLTLDLTGGQDHAITVQPAAGVSVTVRGEDGGPLPCKVQFIGVDGTPDPDLGPIIRARGCDNQYHSKNGRFTQALPPGNYRVVITRGIEYDHVEQTIEVPAGRIVPVEAALRRVVDTRGWISSDFHNHTTISGDNYCGVDDRIINLAAEHIEFAPSTEHNRIYDWQPHVEQLGLTAHVNTIVGLELTGRGPHLNAFPLEPEPFRQDHGAPQWDPDPRINAILLRHHPGDLENRWVHLNHPNLPRYFNYREPPLTSRMPTEPAQGPYPLLASFIDGSEVWGHLILSNELTYEIERGGRTRRPHNRAFQWLQMLNAGYRVWNIAVSDAHEITQGGVGGWRTYLPSSTDEPADLDYAELIAHAKTGRSFVTTGPFLEVKTSCDHWPGDTITSSEPITLQVRVQCNTWTDIDRVAVLVNGRIHPELDIRRSDRPDMFSTGTVRFEQDLRVTLETDAHLIVVAIGEGFNLQTGYGRSWQSQLPPVAYHNPIFVDFDGQGFQHNNDTLDQPYLKTP